MITEMDLAGACASGDDDFVREALDQGVAPHGEATPDGVVPLFQAAEHGHTTVVGLLLAAGVGINDRLRPYGESVLMRALYGGEAMVRLLLEQGADPRPEQHAPKIGGLIAAAAHMNNASMIALLLEHGADLHAVDQEVTGRTALLVAAWLGHEGLVPVLVQHGLSVHAKDRHGMTALHWAVRGSHDRVAQALIDHGGDLNATDHQGINVLHLAAGASPFTRNVVKAAQIDAERAVLRIDAGKVSSADETGRERRRL